MYDTHAELKNAETPTEPVLRGTTRWLIAIVLVMGPLLQAIEFLLAGGEKDSAARVAFWSAFPSRTGLSMAGNPTGATSVLNAESLGLPGVVFLMLFLGGAVLGTLTLAIVIWRSPYIPRIVVLFMLAFAVLDFVLGQGVISHLVNLVSFIILAVAILNGYSRVSRSVTTPAAQIGA